MAPWKPTSLYRYRPFGPDVYERELSAIERPYVWCSTYKSMNDPMEGYYEILADQEWREAGDGCSRSYEYLQPELRPAKRVWNHHRDDMTASLLNQKSEIGLASFSETYENDLMWAHYAKNYSGICIEYDYRRLTEAIEADRDEFLEPVSYSDEVFQLPFPGSLDLSVVARRILLRKKYCWHYENEWRLLSRVGQHELPPGSITAIFLGSRIDESFKKKLIHCVQGLAAEWHNTPSIVVLQMTVVGYKHSFERIETSPH